VWAPSCCRADASVKVFALGGPDYLAPKLSETGTCRSLRE
jgi:hypothetical protein